MIRWAIYGMIYLGSLLMIYNIFGFIRFLRYIRARGNWGEKMVILYIPVVLLVLFLIWLSNERRLKQILRPIRS